MKRLLVIGAAGDVGQGIVRAGIGLGWQVAASGRTAATLKQVTAGLGERAFVIPGSVSSVNEAHRLFDDALARLGGIDAVVVSVNAASTARPMLDWDPRDLLHVIEENVISHFIAAKTIIPRLAAGGIYIGIGGGLADVVPPRRGQVSMGQAALRVMYRAIAKEARKFPVHIRQLMILSMVNGQRTREIAEPAWITEDEVGRHICTIIAEQDRFPGPILTLTSREQVAQREV